MSFYSTTSLMHTQFHDESTKNYWTCDEHQHADTIVVLFMNFCENFYWTVIFSCDEMRWDEMKKVFFSAYIYIKIWLADQRSNCHEDESLSGKIETGTCKECFFSEIRTSLLKIKFTRK